MSGISQQSFQGNISGTNFAPVIRSEGVAITRYITTASILAYLAAEAISALRVVYIEDGEALVASSGNLSAMDRLAGVAITASNAGVTVNVQSAGVLEDDFFNWTLYSPIFCGSSGVLTQTPPVIGFSQIVGFPIDSKKMIIDIKQAIKI